MKRTVNDLLRDKGTAVWSITPDATVYEAIQFIAEKGIGALLVKENDRVVGLISERDYARKVILEGRSSRDTLVRDVMSADVVSVRPDQPVSDCMELMTDKRIRHLPVMQDGELLGLVSIGDLVKEVIAEQQFIIDQLENYISG